MPTTATLYVSPASPLRVEPQTPALPVKVQRIPALDFTKGMLVLFMVLYHWLNYFIGPQGNYYRYLRFITPSFIFISGFIVSNIYISKYHTLDRRLSKRLFTRGIKLIAVFVALNMGRFVLQPVLSSYSHVSMPNLKELVQIFVTGDYVGKSAAFYILIPIAYLLMLSGIIMLACRPRRFTFHVICSLLMLGVAALSLFGFHSSNMELLAIGMLGAVIGARPIAAIDRFLRYPYALAFAYCCYLVAIKLWNVPYLLQIAGVLLSVMIVYKMCPRKEGSQGITNEIVLLGRYSLFGYISQIAILQILAACFRHLNLGVIGLAASLAAAFILTGLSVEALDRLRARSVGVDRWYKLIFA